MKDTLQPGIEREFSFVITEAKTVPALYPESSEFQDMPDVLRPVHGRFDRMDLHPSGKPLP